MDNSDLVKGLAVAPAQVGTITVLYFARLKDALGVGSEHLVLPPSISTVEGLRQHLRARGGAWEAELAATRPVRVAVNQVMAARDVRVDPGDEVAFFPPVTGG